VIHVLSSNTAHEVILGVPRLSVGEVHRAATGHRRVGGKGVNVARACGRMGVPVRLVAIADLRGADELAREPDLAEALLDVVPLAGHARTDVIVAESDGRTTVVNGVGDAVPSTLVERAVGLLVSRFAPDDLVVLAGSLPRGAPIELYATLAHAARTHGVRSIVDASGMWLRASLTAPPDICKVNVGELADMLGAGPAACWRDGGRLVPSVPSLVLSRGASGARVWTDGGRCTIRVPRQRVVSGVGAGDAMTAGMAAALAEGSPLVDAVVRGAAWGAAAVRELDLTLDPDVARSIEPNVRVIGRVPA
jgi:1-phosphofructokinase family hexose kinase